ncbi:hypothetical protein PENTCL1PPCAC_8262, partial [Pristionchus entomophagus]
LVKIEEERRKSYEFSRQSNDGLHSLMSRGFDYMALIHSKTSDRNLIRRALRTLESEQKISMEFEISNDPTRVMSFGFIESVHLTFLHFTDKIDSQQALIDSLQAQVDLNIPKSTVEQYAQTDQISVELLLKDMIKLEEEMINEN